MTLMTIKDFKARPCALEYMLFYTACSSAIVILSAAYFGQIAAIWLATNTAIFAATALFLFICKTKRQARATQFYLEWLHSLHTSDVEKLKHRVRVSSPEYRILSNMHYTRPTKEESLNCSFNQS